MRSFGFAATLSLAAIVVAGCAADRLVAVERITDGGGVDAGGVDAGGMDGGGTDAGADGCEAPDVQPGYAVTSIDIDGGTRTYGLFVPTGDVHTPRALVFGFDGHGTSAECRAALGLEGPANGAAIFVYPENEPDADGNRSWQTDDDANLVFVDTLVTTLKKRACTTAVFVAGFGSGGSMANRLACVRGDVVRGMASFSGGSPVSGCDDREVAAFLTYGDSDTLVSPAIARDHWLTQDKCKMTSQPVTPDPCVTYDGCDPNFPVTWCEFSGGHEIPDWAPPAAWAFFASLK